MRRPRNSWLLALFLALGLVRPALAEEDDVEVTDELPDWMEAEAWAIPIEAGEGYGADIPSPEEVAFGAAAPAAPAQAPAPMESAPREIEFEDFREGLAPHGRWVQTPEYGLVFVPSSRIQVDGWRPYLHGQWVWTRYGWTWVSDEPFGWATYHYGRWGHRVGLGWFWVPGYTWGPAWVTWRHGPDSIGWAPLYPGYVRVTASYPVVVDHWVFVSHVHFHAHPIHRHWHRHRHHHHFHRSHWARNWRSSGRVYAGPPRTFVERRVGRVHEVRIVRAGRPAPSRVIAGERSRRVEIYRPAPRVRSAKPTVERRSGSPAVRRPSDSRAVPQRQASPAVRRRENATPSVRRPSDSRAVPQRQASPAVRQRRNAAPDVRRPSGSQATPQRQASPAVRQRPAATQRSFTAPSRSERPKIGASSGSRSSPRSGPQLRAPSRGGSKPGPARTPSRRGSSSRR